MQREPSYPVNKIHTAATKHTLYIRAHTHVWPPSPPGREHGTYVHRRTQLFTTIYTAQYTCIGTHICRTPYAVCRMPMPYAVCHMPIYQQIRVLLQSLSGIVMRRPQTGTSRHNVASWKSVDYKPNPNKYNLHMFSYTYVRVCVTMQGGSSSAEPYTEIHRAK